jgi:hypothetical protein
MEPGETWYHDNDFPPATVSVWDPSAVVMLHGPARTATYRDELGSTGMVIRDFNKMTYLDKLRFANGGHIITEDSDGVMKIYCKKMYLKFGKKKFPLPPLPPLIIVSEAAVATYCPVCKRFVKLREQLINYQWGEWSKPIGILKI